jgi:hypothetical protein
MCHRISILDRNLQMEFQEGFYKKNTLHETMPRQLKYTKSYKRFNTIS